MLKVKAWFLSDLGNAYGFATTNCEYCSENGDELAHTYIRMAFSFDSTDPENLEMLKENDIKWKELNYPNGYFTSDITYFPSESITGLKTCLADEMEALCNIKSPVVELKEYLNWFIRNVDCANAVHVDVYLDRQQMIEDAKQKLYVPLLEIEARMHDKNPLKEKLGKKFPDLWKYKLRRV